MKKDWHPNKSLKSQLFTKTIILDTVALNISQLKKWFTDLLAFTEFGII